MLDAETASSFGLEVAVVEPVSFVVVQFHLEADRVAGFGLEGVINFQVKSVMIILQFRSIGVGQVDLKQILCVGMEMTSRRKCPAGGIDFG